MEGGRADRAGPGGGHSLGGEGREVRRPLPCVPPRKEKAPSPGKRPKKVGHLLPDFVAAASSRRPGSRDESPRRSGAEPQGEPANGLFDDPGGKSPPSDVDGGAHRHPGIGDQDRDAVGRPDPDSRPRERGPQGVPLPLSSPPPDPPPPLPPPH